MYRGEGQLNKKIRNAQLAQWNYILVAGENEMANGTVNIRTREDGREGEMKVDAFAAKLKSLIPKASASHTNFYSKIWKAEDFGLEPKVVQGIKSTTILAKHPEAAEETKGGNSNFPEALKEIESKLSRGDMYLGGKQPSYEDREAFDSLNGAVPDPEIHPHAFPWFCIVSRFNPEVRAQWAGLKPLKQEDWKNALGKFSCFRNTLLFNCFLCLLQIQHLLRNMT